MLTCIASVKDVAPKCGSTTWPAFCARHLHLAKSNHTQINKEEACLRSCCVGFSRKANAAQRSMTETPWPWSGVSMQRISFKASKVRMATNVSRAD